MTIRQHFAGPSGRSRSSNRSSRLPSALLIGARAVLSVRPGQATDLSGLHRAPPYVCDRRPLRDVSDDCEAARPGAIPRSAEGYIDPQAGRAVYESLSFVRPFDREALDELLQLTAGQVTAAAVHAHYLGKRAIRPQSPRASRSHQIGRAADAPYY